MNRKYVTKNRYYQLTVISELTIEAASGVWHIIQ